MSANKETKQASTQSTLVDNGLYRVGAITAILGVVILLVRQTTTLLHPMGEPGNTPEAAAATFTAYAAHEYWVVAHLLEFLGFVLIFGALVILAWRMRTGRAKGWALLGAVGAGVSLSLAAGMQAVDGIALKVMVNRWADAPTESQDLLFEGAYTIRQVEGAFMAMLFVVLGLTVFLFSIGFVNDVEAPSWLGVLGIAVSALTIATGTVVSHAPFEGLTGVPEPLVALLGAGIPLLSVWLLLVARFLLQSSRQHPVHHAELQSRNLEGDDTQTVEDHGSV